jgi:hypothetical protein
MQLVGQELVLSYSIQSLLAFLRSYSDTVPFSVIKDLPQDLTANALGTFLTAFPSFQELVIAILSY